MLGADGRAEDLGLGGAREPRPSITRTNFACTNTRTFGLDACHAMLVGPGPDAPREWSDGPSRLGRTCSLQNHLCYHLFVLWPFREFVFFFIIKKKKCSGELPNRKGSSTGHKSSWVICSHGRGR